MKPLNPLFAILVCPQCRGELDYEPTRFACLSCAAVYPILYGIPDFRPAGANSVYYDDPAQVRAVAEKFDELTQVEIEDATFGAGDAFQTAYRKAAEQRSDDHWQEAVELAGGIPVEKLSAALDIGCGLGGNVVSLAKKFDQAYSIDISYKPLLVAKKRLEGRGLAARALVLAASAEALPFREGAFDFVTAINVIEHVEDQPLTLQEMHRVLRHGGAAFFDSPNRFTLLPEPHVKLWGVGFLPRSWADPYVRFRQGTGYKGKRLLSLLELKRFLRKDFKDSFEIGVPSFEARDYYPDGRLKKLARAAFNGLLRKTPGVSHALVPFAPTFNVLARKP